VDTLLTEKQMGAPMPKKNKRKRRTFSKEFRAEAVALARESGKPIADVAEDIGVAESSLFAWIRQAKIDDGQVGGMTTDEKEELTALRKEVRQLKMERDFLKKTAAYFASEKK